MNLLPQRCYYQDSQKKLCLIVNGMEGYFLPIPSDQQECYEFYAGDGSFDPSWDAGSLNEMLGVSPEEVEAMLGGSMFGWGCPIVRDYKPSSEYARHISKINADKILQDMEAEGL